MAETKIDQQKQLISLLLHDFEDDASDWLWETDATGRLRHVSSRLADTLGLSPSRLQGQLITNILLGHENAFENVPSGDMQKLAACFNQAGPFRNIELPFMLAGEKRCWSLSGKPLFDNQEKIIGWRGVGSDITAQRELQASREAAARVAGELDAARRIQMGLLPDLAAITNKEHRFSVAATLEPALEVGGDYYDCFALDEKRICFAVADVSGKGVPASLFMAMTKTLAANLARQKADLGEALSELSCELDRNNPEMLFVTTFIAVLDLESGELSCTSAGHDLPLLLRAGQVSRLDIEEASGPPMCAVPGYRFQSAKQHLQPGDTLCLFTDGVTEACNGADFYGARRLTHLFASLEDNTPVSSYTDALRRDIREFEIGTAPSDDLTIMVLRWNGMTA